MKLQTTEPFPHWCRYASDDCELGVIFLQKRNKIAIIESSIGTEAQTLTVWKEVENRLQQLLNAFGRGNITRTKRAARDNHRDALQ